MDPLAKNEFLADKDFEILHPPEFQQNVVDARLVSQSKIILFDNSGSMSKEFAE